ncbi:vWA domain-containing protein [Methylocucumis oryzae]|uniref:vWA domain-containing protein n=1 Tax=Methylocucumis oryzae TaxID=1632867 RepID=UPI000A7C051D
MTFAFNQPAWLLALAFVLLPLGLIGAKTSRYAWLGLIPADAGAISVTVILKFLGATALFTLVLGLAGLHTTGQVLERIGLGANIVLLLDRSNSMDNSFAGSLPDGGQESKAAAARRLLKSFINERPHDLLGIVEYSTSPLFVLPLTDNKQALQAAIDATTLPALAYTHVSKGLSMALSLFDKPDLTGSRMVLLVSDGAAAIDASSELALRQYFKQQQVRFVLVVLTKL